MRPNFSTIWVFVFFLLIGFCATSNATNPVGLSQPSGLQASLSGSDIALSWTAGTATAGQTLSSGNTSCAIDNNGAAWCWGPSYDGELGNGSTASATTGTPTQVVGGHVLAKYLRATAALAPSTLMALPGAGATLTMGVWGMAQHRTISILEHLRRYWETTCSDKYLLALPPLALSILPATPGAGEIHTTASWVMAQQPPRIRERLLRSWGGMCLVRYQWAHKLFVLSILMALHGAGARPTMDGWVTDQQQKGPIPALPLR